MSHTLKLCPALLGAPRLTLFNLNLLRHMSGRRDKLYGFEEGHHSKNEVRKENWIKKRYRRSMGAQWRIENGYELNPLTVGFMSKIPDWSCPSDGTAGALSAKQISKRLENLELVKSIYEAAMLVHQANNLKPKNN